MDGCVLVSLILVRFDRALKVKMLAEETLKELMPTFFDGD